MTVPVRLEIAQPIIMDDGSMQRTFAFWTIAVTNKLPITGAGSPEGVITAPQFSIYYDETGTTGSITYIKLQSDIGGDRSQGWVLE